MIKIQIFFRVGTMVSIKDYIMVGIIATVKVWIRDMIYG